MKFGEISRRLNAERVAGRKGGKWRTSRISVVLQREGKYKVRAYKSPGPRVPLHYDRETATSRAQELRAEGLSLREPLDGKVGRYQQVSAPLPRVTSSGARWHLLGLAARSHFTGSLGRGTCHMTFI